MIRRHTRSWVIGEMSVNGQPTHAPSVPVVIASDSETVQVVEDVESAPPSLVRRRPLRDTGYRFVAEGLDD